MELAGKRVREGKNDSDCQSVYNKRLPPAIEVRPKSYIRLCSIEDGVAATAKALDDEYLDLFPDGAIVSVPIAAGEKEVSTNFRYSLVGLFAQCEHQIKVPHTIKGSVRRVGLPVTDNGLDILRIVE